MHRLLLILLLTLLSSTFSSAQSQSLLADLDAWQTIASDGVKIAASSDRGALRIDFDFGSGAGYGGVFLDLPVDLPENYEFKLKLRGEGPANNLELKLVDPDKLNVWWVNRRAFEWPGASTQLNSRRKHFQFAWGPSGGKPLAKVGRVELIIAAAEGGRGSVWIEDFQFSALPPSQPYTATPNISASSGIKDAALQNLLRDASTDWIADASDTIPQLVIDFGQEREIGGAIIQFAPGHAPSDFDLQSSPNGTEWTTIRAVRGSTGLPAALSLTDLQTRFLRLAFSQKSSPVSVGVRNIRFLETADGASPNAFLRARAATASRGIYPRSLLNQQSFWTVIGQPDDEREALINEEGQIEVDKRGFSVEPFIVRDGKLLTWSDAAHSQSLCDRWIPIPSVERVHDGLKLTITALADGAAGSSNLQAAYRVQNTGAMPVQAKLVLAIRGIQVLPPWQDLNIIGGFTPIRSIASDDQGVLVNDNKRIFPSAGFATAAATSDAGDVVEMLSVGNVPRSVKVECPQQSASGMISWEISLAPGESVTHLICVPFHGIEAPRRPATSEEFESLAVEIAKQWSSRVDKVKFRLPQPAKDFHDTLRATQAYILINHDGKGFQPGSRTYERSWIRDGSMTSAAMLQFGHDELVTRFVNWYAPFQFPSGKVPCVVDRRGADAVPEHDSHGQLIWLIANTHRFTSDIELVKRHFPRIEAAVAYIESLRAQRLTDEFSATGPARQEPGKSAVPGIAFRGLVPESISHEGYSAKPMHSFWDTFYILRGLKDAAYLAEVVGKSDLAARWNALADEFRSNLIGSITASQKAHGIDYLPGCVELGDFDSTSSTILIWPVQEAACFPRQWIDATFNRYWKEFTARRDNLPAKWEAYTPYELRHIGAYVRLGQKDRALAVMNWLMGHQRPSGWRHFAEVVWRDRDMPRMIGDMPHTWCGSDFLNSARSMFVYEDDSRLVLFAGVPEDWILDPTGVGFDQLPTPFGKISAVTRMLGPDHLQIQFTGDANPKQGFDLVSPLSRDIRSATVDGESVNIHSGARIQFQKLPATIDLKY